MMRSGGARGQRGGGDTHTNRSWGAAVSRVESRGMRRSVEESSVRAVVHTRREGGEGGEGGGGREGGRVGRALKRAAELVARRNKPPASGTRSAMCIKSSPPRLTAAFGSAIVRSSVIPTNAPAGILPRTSTDADATERAESCAVSVCVRDRGAFASRRRRRRRGSPRAHSSTHEREGAARDSSQTHETHAVRFGAVHLNVEEGGVVEQAGEVERPFHDPRRERASRQPSKKQASSPSQAPSAQAPKQPPRPRPPPQQPTSVARGTV